MSSPAAGHWFEDPKTQAVRLNRLSGGAGVRVNIQITTISNSVKPYYFAFLMRLIISAIEANNTTTINPIAGPEHIENNPVASKEKSLL